MLNVFQTALLAALPDRASQFLVTVRFGELEQLFTGLMQASFIIGVLILVIGILLIFFPGLKTFLGKLVGG